MNINFENMKLDPASNHNILSFGIFEFINQIDLTKLALDAASRDFDYDGYCDYLNRCNQSGLTDTPVEKVSKDLYVFIKGLFNTMHWIDYNLDRLNELETRPITDSDLLQIGNLYWLVSKSDGKVEADVCKELGGQKYFKEHIWAIKDNPQAFERWDIIKINPLVIPTKKLGDGEELCIQ